MASCERSWPLVDSTLYIRRVRSFAKNSGDATVFMIYPMQPNQTSPMGRFSADTTQPRLTSTVSFWRLRERFLGSSVFSFFLSTEFGTVAEGGNYCAGAIPGGLFPYLPAPCSASSTPGLYRTASRGQASGRTCSIRRVRSGSNPVAGLMDSSPLWLEVWIPCVPPDCTSELSALDNHS